VETLKELSTMLRIDTSVIRVQTKSSFLRPRLLLTYEPAVLVELPSVNRECLRTVEVARNAACATRLLMHTGRTEALPGLEKPMTLWQALAALRLPEGASACGVGGAVRRADVMAKAAFHRPSSDVQTPRDTSAHARVSESVRRSTAHFATVRRPAARTTYAPRKRHGPAPGCVGCAECTDRATTPPRSPQRRHAPASAKTRPRARQLL